MGLHISTLEAIPTEAKGITIFTCWNFGWDEPLGEALKKNFDKMAELASENGAAVIRGVNRVHFEDEVLSWHHINGADGEEMLPAILITNRHPRTIKESYGKLPSGNDHADIRMIFIPLRKHCKTSTDVLRIIDLVFKDIRSKKPLHNFEILREMKKGVGRSLVDALILQPNVGGVGVDLKILVNNFLGMVRLKGRKA